MLCLILSRSILAPGPYCQLSWLLLQVLDAETQADDEAEEYFEADEDEEEEEEDLNEEQEVEYEDDEVCYGLMLFPFPMQHSASQAAGLAACQAWSKYRPFH